MTKKNTKRNDQRAQLYHRTARQSMLRILAEGFRSGRGHYMMSLLLRGVFVSDRPVDVNEGACGNALLDVSIDLSLIERYELIEDGKPYREWCVPAYILNRRAKLVVLEEGDDNDKPKGDNLVPRRKRKSSAS